MSERWLWIALAVVVGCDLAINLVFPRGIYVPVALAFAAALLLVAAGAGVPLTSLGLRAETLPRAVLVGLSVTMVLATAYLVISLLPATAPSLAGGRAAALDGRGLAYETLWRIPFGTVIFEEIAFRGVLPTLLGAAPAQRWSWSAVLISSALFGLWHVIPALGMSQRHAAVSALGADTWLTVLGTVVVTAIAGIGFSALAWLGQGLLTSILAHWALNSIGLAAAYWVTHR